MTRTTKTTTDKATKTSTAAVTTKAPTTPMNTAKRTKTIRERALALACEVHLENALTEIAHAGISWPLLCTYADELATIRGEEEGMWVVEALEFVGTPPGIKAMLNAIALHSQGRRILA